MSSRLQPRIMIRSRHIDFPIKLICESQNFTTRKYNRITVNKQSIYIKLSSVTWTWLVVTGRIDLHGVSLARFPAIDRVMTSPCPHLVSTPTGGATATPTTPLTHVTVDCNISVILHNIITTFDNQLLLPYHIFWGGGGGGIVVFKKRYYLLRVYVTTVVLVYNILTKIRFHVRSFNYKLLVSFSVAFFFFELARAIGSFLTCTRKQGTNLNLRIFASTRQSIIFGRWIWAGAISCLSSLVTWCTARWPFCPEWPFTIY